MGPWIATPDEVPNLPERVLSTRVNGAELQRAELNLLIRDVATMVSYVSVFTSLEVGDLIPMWWKSTSLE